MNTGVLKVGGYVMQCLEYAAENGCNVAELRFSADEIIDVLNRRAHPLDLAFTQQNAALALMNPMAILSERELAGAFGNDPRTIRSMVDRDEIPPPVELGNKKIWFPGRVLSFIDRRMEQAERDAQRRSQRKANLLGGGV